MLFGNRSQLVVRLVGLKGEVAEGLEMIWIAGRKLPRLPVLVLRPELDHIGQSTTFPPPERDTFHLDRTELWARIDKLAAEELITDVWVLGDLKGLEEQLKENKISSGL